MSSLNQQSVARTENMNCWSSSCFKCFGNHKKQNCRKSLASPCLVVMYCCVFESQDLQTTKTKGASKENRGQFTMPQKVNPWHYILSTKQMWMLPVFCDGGCNASYITYRATEQFKAKKVKKLSLGVTTMGNVEKTWHMAIRDVALQRKSPHIDLLVGCAYLHLHPKQEEASCGDNLLESACKGLILIKLKEPSTRPTLRRKYLI